MGIPSATGMHETGVFASSSCTVSLQERSVTTERSDVKGNRGEKGEALLQDLCERDSGTDCQEGLTHCFGSNSPQTC